MTPLPNTLCPLCGGSNECAPANRGSFDAPCWCTRVSISKQALASIPDDQIDTACLCPQCAQTLSAAQKQPS